MSTGPIEVEKELGLTYVPFDELLQSRLRFHPRTLDGVTHHLIGERELKLMKKTAYSSTRPGGRLWMRRPWSKPCREEIAGAGVTSSKMNRSWLLAQPSWTT